VGQFEPGSPISRLGREPDWQAMVIDHLKMNAGPATFGAQVQAARGLLGWTRARLSSERGLSAPSLRRIEKGLTGRPYAKTRTAICSAFEAAGIGVTIADLPTLRSKKAAAADQRTSIGLPPTFVVDRARKRNLFIIHALICSSIESQLLNLVARCAPDQQQMCKFLISAVLAATISWASPVCLAFAAAAESGPANFPPGEPGPKPDCWQGSTGNAHCNV
jgi:transcriptional regulator with XRE-family HTH domain